MENKYKHLEFIQGVINRLYTNSFLLKGWSVVLISALFALSAANSKIEFIFLAYILAIAFWGLDGYFLAVEKKYRDLYDNVRLIEPDLIDFNMKASINASEWAAKFMSKHFSFFMGL